MAKKPVKVGVERGAGPPPGYLWNIVILDIAFNEAMGFLNEGQYKHLRHQFLDLACEQDPTHSETVDVRPVEDFHELRDCGGILGGLNIRVFFWIDKRHKAIAILGVAKKQNDGPTPQADKIRVRGRKRRYVALESEVASILGGGEHADEDDAARPSSD